MKDNIIYAICVVVSLTIIASNIVRINKVNKIINSNRKHIDQWGTCFHYDKSYPDSIYFITADNDTTWYKKYPYENWYKRTSCE